MSATDAVEAATAPPSPDGVRGRAAIAIPGEDRRGKTTVVGMEDAVARCVSYRLVPTPGRRASASWFGPPGPASKGGWLLRSRPAVTERARQLQTTRNDCHSTPNIVSMRIGRV